MGKWKILSREEAIELFLSGKNANIYQIDTFNCNVNEMEIITMGNLEKENNRLFYTVYEVDENDQK